MKCYCFTIIIAIIRKTKSSSQCPVICNDRRQQGEVAKVKPFSPLQPCLFQLVELSAPSMAPKGAKCLGLLLIQAARQSYFCATPLFPVEVPLVSYMLRVSMYRVSCWQQKCKAPCLCSNNGVHMSWHICNISLARSFVPFYLQGTQIKWLVCQTQQASLTVYHVEEARLEFSSRHKLNMLTGMSLKPDLIRTLWYFKLSYQSVIP